MTDSKHVWLCLDPGITTGMAVLDDSGEVRATTVWGTAELESSLDNLIRGLHLTGYTITAVIEQMPQVGGLGKLAAKLEAVRRVVMLVVVETYEIPVIQVLPGEWKPSRVARTTEVPWHFQRTKMLIHQKDAIRMGRYVIDREKEN